MARSIVTQANADVLLLQELSFPAGGIDEFRELRSFAEDVGLPHTQAWPLSPSHHDGKKRLGVAIMCRFPLIEPVRSLFPNPELVTRYGQQDEWRSHDKGLLTTKMVWNRLTITVGTTHLLPFIHFGRDPEDPEFASIWSTLERFLRLLAQTPSVIAGDFNTDRLPYLLPGILRSGDYLPLMQEPTTPKGARIDEILCSSHWVPLERRVVPTIANHHLCVAELMLKGVPPCLSFIDDSGVK